MNKKFMRITSIMVLFIALVGFWGYNKYLTPDPEIQQQLNSQFGEDFFNPFDAEIVNNSDVVNNSEAVVNDANSNKIDSPINVVMPDKAKEQEKGITTIPVNEISIVKGITQDDISNKYKPQFDYLQNVALGRLDTLYAAAMQEYRQSGKAGESNRSKLAQKYIQAGTMLETSVDNKFYSTLNAMQTELIANNLTTDIVSLSKNEYEKFKSSKRSQLLAKVMK